MSEVFKLPIRVYIEDTDAGGVVFYANYLKYFERARTELVRNLGIGLRDGLEHGVSYVVRKLDIKYLKPAKLDDLVLASAKVSSVSKASMTFSQCLLSEEGDLLVEANVQVACVSYPDLKPRALSAELRTALSTLLTE